MERKLNLFYNIHKYITIINDKPCVNANSYRMVMQNPSRLWVAGLFLYSLVECCFLRTLYASFYSLVRLYSPSTVNR